MKLGDNSKFFHALTKWRRARNRITGLHDENGIWSIEDDDIQHIGVSYFQNLFSTSNPQTSDEALGEIEIQISDLDKCYFNNTCDGM